MKKITTMNGHISYLIEQLQSIYDKYGDLPVSICGSDMVHMYWDEENGYLILDSEPNLEDIDEDDIIGRLNKEFEISLVCDKYITNDTKEIVANNIKELVEYYTEVFQYKINCLFKEDLLTKHFYEDVIEKLSKCKED